MAPSIPVVPVTPLVAARQPQRRSPVTAVVGVERVRARVIERVRPSLTSRSLKRLVPEREQVRLPLADGADARVVVVPQSP